MRRKIIPYDPNLKMIARELRNNSTLPQILLWLQLKGKKMLGFDFHRQKPIDNYIVDFFCNELMIGIEILNSAQDLKDNSYRDRRLNNLGIRMMYFTDDQVLNDMVNVLSTIQNHILRNPEHTPNPSQEGSTPPKQNQSPQ